MGDYCVSLQDLVSRLLERRPARRLGMLWNGMNGVKQHPWFKVGGSRHEVRACSGMESMSHNIVDRNGVVQIYSCIQHIST